MSGGVFAVVFIVASFTAIAGGCGLVFLLTRDEGFYRSWHWRVHLTDLGRAWAAEILAPGGNWETVGAVPREAGRAAATELAWRTVDARSVRRA